MDLIVFLIGSKARADTLVIYSFPMWYLWVGKVAVTYGKVISHTSSAAAY